MEMNTCSNAWLDQGNLVAFIFVPQAASPRCVKYCGFRSLRAAKAAAVGSTASLLTLRRCPDTAVLPCFSGQIRRPPRPALSRFKARLQQGNTFRALPG